MKSAAFDYLRPASLDEALAALAGAGNHRLMAGSQSLGPMLNLRLARPAQVIDTSGVDELRSVTRDGPDLRLGAGITHAEIEDAAWPLLRDTPLPKVAAGIAYRAIRNRGTLGGSLAHADPAADWLLVMRVLGARLELRSQAGSRQLPLSEFVLGAYATALGEHEMIVAVRIPAFSASARWGYHKFCRKPGEFAHASCAALLDVPNGRCSIAVGALDGAPRELAGLARALAQPAAAPWDLSRGGAIGRVLEESVAAVMPSADAIDRQLQAECVRRCLREALQGKVVA